MQAQEIPLGNQVCSMSVDEVQMIVIGSQASQHTPRCENQRIAVFTSISPLANGTLGRGGDFLCLNF